MYPLQSLSKSQNGQRRKGTNAKYMNQYNAFYGMVVVVSVLSPQYSSKLDENKGSIVPVVKTWSDISWVEYWSQANTGARTPERLKYFLIHTVVNFETREVVDELQPSIPKWGDDGNKYFSTTIEPNRAMLGTPLGRGMSYFLLNHKAQLGVKEISGFRIFMHETAITFPSILFYVDDVARPLADDDDDAFCKMCGVM
jgi:hypothetical protein